MSGSALSAAGLGPARPRTGQVFTGSGPGLAGPLMKFTWKPEDLFQEWFSPPKTGLSKKGLWIVLCSSYTCSCISVSGFWCSCLCSCPCLGSCLLSLISCISVPCSSSLLPILQPGSQPGAPAWSTLGNLLMFSRKRRRQKPIRSHMFDTLPMGPRFGLAPGPCCGGCPTSWFTEGSLLIPPAWSLFIGDRTGPYEEGGWR